MLLEPAGVDGGEEAADVEAVQVRPRPDQLDVVANGLLLIGGDEEGEVARVGSPGRRDRVVHVVFAAGRHPALGVGDDHRAVDAEEVRREHERAQHVVGHTGAGVAQDLRVARLQPEHRQRLDPRVHAGQDGESPGRHRLEPRKSEVLRVGVVGRQHVVERRVPGHGGIVGE